ncbi:MULTISPECIES: TlpA family protein disulfide reductase [unclassified Streptomyces]|uniref:TlpA family protein disulfide reductase n=1 Tax=unclassified Streptomyces TaxID=2593676 RepID=UPI002E1E96F3|nr:TlpA family protein disulfide reductase [Streptomyces sp. NBC_01023]
MRLKYASTVALLTTLSIAGVVALAGCGTSGTSGGGGQANYIAGTGGISTVPRKERKTPNEDEFKGLTLQGDHFALGSLKGKVVVINVWGSWCPPCRAEAPHFAKVARQTKNQGVAFIGINTRDTNQDKGIAFEKEYNVTYPSLYDPTGRVVLNGFPKGSLNPQTIPSTIALDRDGKIAARALRPLTEENLHQMIDPLILEK